MQKEKDDNINLFQRQVEMLRSQLKEKEKKIFELKKQNYLINNSSKKYSRNNSIKNMKEKSEIKHYMNKGKRNISSIRNTNLFCNKNKNNKNNQKINKKLSTYTYCFNESNEEMIASNNNFNFLSKITSQTNMKNIKKRNNPKNRCRSEEMRKDKT